MMKKLFEYSDLLNSPFEAFTYDAETMTFPIRSHWHHYVEILRITEGSACVICDSREYIAKEGDIVIISARAVHSIALVDGPLKYDVVKFNVNELKINGSYLIKASIVLSNSCYADKFRFHITKNELKSIDIAAMFKLCITEYLHRDFGYDVVIKSTLSHILVEITRIWRRDGANLLAVQPVNEAESEIHDVVEYIDTHFSEPLFVTELAKLCNMSYSHFAREFKVNNGRSCKEYIEFIRITKAEDLLMFTDMDLTSISQETGFSDCSHFIRTFRKFKQLTPKQFKKSLQKDKKGIDFL